MRRLVAAALGACVALGGWAALPASADQPPVGAAPPPRDVSFEQRLDARLPVGSSLLDERGQARRFDDFLGAGALGAAALIVVPAYYRCPDLCNIVLDGVAEASTALPLRAGADYRVVVLGIDPDERPADARAVRARLIEKFPTAGIAAGWSFLTGTFANMKPLTDAIGFHYHHDLEHDQYAHAAGIVVVTADGRIARYLFGVRFDPATLESALRDAAGGRIGGLANRLLLLCFHYDPESGRYSLLIGRTLTFVCLLTALIVGGAVLRALHKERSRGGGTASRAAPGAHPGPDPR